MELPEINVSMVTQLWVGWDWKGWKCHYRQGLSLNELFRHFVQFLYYENVKKWTLKAVKCGWLSSALVTKKHKSWSYSKKRWQCFIVACFKVILSDSSESTTLKIGVHIRMPATDACSVMAILQTQIFDPLAYWQRNKYTKNLWFSCEKLEHKH